MDRQQKEPVWPMLCILGCLLVLSAIAPRSWQKVARVQSTTEMLQPPSLASRVATPAPAVDERKPLPPMRLAAPPTVTRPQPVERMPLVEVPRLVEVADPAAKVGGVVLDFNRPEWQLGSNPADVKLAPAVASASPPKSAEPTRDELVAEKRLEKAERPSPVENRAAQVSNTATPRQPELVASRTAKPSAAAIAPAVPVQRAEPTEEEVAAALAAYPWKTPASLEARLKQLAAHPATADWAAKTTALLTDLTQSMNEGSDDIAQVAQRLIQTAYAADTLANQIADADAARQLRRASHAVLRQSSLWAEAVAIAGPTFAPAHDYHVDRSRLALCLNTLHKLDDGSEHGRAWHNYLMLDALTDMLAKPESSAERNEKRLAQRVLARLTRSGMNEAQREFVANDDVKHLREELRNWAAEPVDLTRLLTSVERFEQSGRSSDARYVAADCRRLGFSPDASERKLAEQIETHYRNANMRLMFTQSLINRFMPAPEPELAPVDDVIFGLPVHGRSLTSSQLAVRFLPDERRLRMQFEVQGEIAAATTSTVGPATFVNDSQGYYIARKPLEIEAHRIRLEPAQVGASNATRLRSLRTNFDAIPLFGMLAQHIARNQHAQQQPLFNSETERRISARAADRIDNEMYSRINEGVAKLGQRLFVPLDNLSLQPAMISGSTTEERMTMRLRLAGDDQLGGDTPRPRAMADSLASLQVHESAINNLFERLDLNGQTMSLPELAKHVAAKLNRPSNWQLDPANEDVEITFAAEDAVHVRCQDGQIVVTLSIVRLSKAPRVWRDFQVRVCYKPQIAGRSAEMVRDGVVQLIGPKLSTGSQIAVRGIFAKVFPKDQAWKLIPDRFLDDPRLADLEVSQFVIEDGWIGVSLSGKSAADVNVAQRPSATR